MWDYFKDHWNYECIMWWVYMTMFNLGFKLFGSYYGIRIAKKPYIKHKMYGFTNRCIDGKYVIALDYDRVDIDWLVSEIKVMINYFNLGTIFIFESSKGSYWVVCLKKVKFRQFVDIMRSSSCDYAHMTVPLNYGMKAWTLRLSPKNKIKPKLIRIIYPKTIDPYMTLSRAHYFLLKKFFKDICITEDEYGLLDDNYELIVSSYGKDGSFINGKK